MPLLKPRQYRRWLHPRTVINMLGMVELRGNETPEQVREAERRALSNLATCYADWGLVRIKRGEGLRATTAYTEESVLEYMAQREAESK